MHGVTYLDNNISASAANKSKTLITCPTSTNGSQTGKPRPNKSIAARLNVLFILDVNNVIKALAAYTDNTSE